MFYIVTVVIKKFVPRAHLHKGLNSNCTNKKNVLLMVFFFYFIFYG